MSAITLSIGDNPARYPRPYEDFNVLKKIIVLSLAGLILLSLTAAGTWAFFNDTETGSENSLSAGTLNLQVGADDPMSESITLDNIQPGDADNLASWAVSNTGSLAGEFAVSVNTVSNAENGCSEVETASGDPGNGEGELGGLLTLALWMDSGNNGWSDGDYYLDPSGGSLVQVAWTDGSGLPDEAYFTVDDFSQKESSNLQLILPNSTPGNFRVDFIFPDNGSADNQAQSDSCTFDIEFSLNQKS
jgi:predicted ribosomally synthesized peptide with SipW-like signal peptide